MMSNTIPKFSELPLNKGDPPFSAWGLYGKDDEVGMINRLSNDIVLKAKDEIQTGERISLNWRLNAFGEQPMLGRQGFHLKQYNKAPRTVNDDEWHFNSQCGTQWDGLRHFAYQKEKKFYNGVTLDDMFNEDKSIKSNVNGIHNWQARGIVGRGILLDYDSWRRENSIEFEPLFSKPYAIPVDHLKSVANAQGTEIHFGDILIVRMGFTAAYEKGSEEQKVAYSKVLEGSGVEQSEEALQWIWENFSAVAADNVSFERWPSVKPWYMHEVFLAGWGMPIGELFDLERLAAHCKKVNRWSFFVSSEPCHVPGAVASPPNILAIF